MVFWRILSGREPWTLMSIVSFIILWVTMGTTCQVLWKSRGLVTDICPIHNPTGNLNKPVKLLEGFFACIAQTSRDSRPRFYHGLNMHRTPCDTQPQISSRALDTNLHYFCGMLYPPKLQLLMSSLALLLHVALSSVWCMACLVTQIFCLVSDIPVYLLFDTPPALTKILSSVFVCLYCPNKS